MSSKSGWKTRYLAWIMTSIFRVAAPRSPLESEGSAWENAYFDWISDVSRYNALESNVPEKAGLFICHSFQLACRYFKLAEVTQRKSTAFGVFRFIMFPMPGRTCIRRTQGSLYAVDSRDFQIIQPRHNRLRELGPASWRRKIRPHVPTKEPSWHLRFNDHMIGAQFHPEADAVGMSLYLQTEEKEKRSLRTTDMKMGSR